MQKQKRWPVVLVTLALALYSQTGLVQEKRSDPVGSAVTSDELLEQRLVKEKPAALAKAARQHGDATRGALLFYQPNLVCTKCHATGEKQSPLGPDLSTMGKDVSDTHIIESLLHPSKVIKKGFEPIIVVTKNGNIVTGLLVKDEPAKLILRDASGVLHTVAKTEIESRLKSKTSIMPTGLVNQLRDRQQFLDLARFLMEIAKHGPVRAFELRPPASFFVHELPAYEKNLDHAGLIASLDEKSFQRGQAIYMRVCANCHGTKDRQGSLPTSLRFASGKFKNGNDPYSMYKTITHGFGMMAPQHWMVPKQKYDVIHYIREAYLKKHNPLQYVKATKKYLAQLPKGTSRGPQPLPAEPWAAMDYGSNLIATYEIGNDGSNFAYKGIAVRLDPGPGGVARGKHWMIFDHDTMRVAAAWSGKGFMDWNAILFNGRHAVHPRIVGEMQVANPTGPGWANPADHRFAEVRLVGRDGRRYGPLPRAWAHYKGLYHFGDKVIVSYTVGKTKVLEMPGLEATKPAAVFSRTFHIGPRAEDMILQVAHQKGATLSPVNKDKHSAVVFAPESTPSSKTKAKNTPLKFDGSTYLAVKRAADFDMSKKDYTIFARIKTRRGGSIFGKMATGPKWVPDGKTLFVRGGRLCFDIGWVGVVTSRRRVNDGRWHDVAMSWDHSSGQVRLYIDGKLDRQGKLEPKRMHSDFVVRVGFTAPNFPRSTTYFDGDIAEVRFYQRRLDDKEITHAKELGKDKNLVARWQLGGASGDFVRNAAGKKDVARIVRGTESGEIAGIVVAGVRGGPGNLQWLAENGNLRLKIPAGKETLQFSLWFARVPEDKSVAPLLASIPTRGGALDLTALTHGGPRHWTETLKTMAHMGNDNGPFAVDVLTRPTKNPWSCRVRLSGLDFFPDGNRAALCAWDGDVWLVTGIAHPEKGLTWQRIASGLFQPLGIKIVNGKIYVCCRDQIVILRDLNGDGETDYYQNFNNDHQVTDHFHEFAMGLQTDKEGNFYYARGARHAKKALVPHHGTLLKVSKDGKHTEILATGFRAPNGVCLNPDGTFFVSDQEGHWNPKNRINWVTRGGFYGNMWGYHDVTDTSDSAMKQPLCWITNSFDRSPAEQLWVTSKKWGPLYGSLLNFSYGYGKVHIIPHEKVNGQMQGGMCELPIPQFPTGVMRGRFHPQNGQLYACGLFGWAGNQQQPGGFYRIRYTGKPVHLPIKLQAYQQGMRLTFSGTLDRKTASDPANYAVKVWSLKRSANYGSKHYNERRLKVAKAKVAANDKTVFLQIPDIQPTWCMEIRYVIRGKEGQRINGVIHNTIHHLQDLERGR